MYKKIFLIFVLFFPRIINASGDKLSDGSCQFDMGTGYKSTKVYINNRQNSYVILSFHDPRYGTTKYIYNGNTCESLTSGDSKKSSYEKLMQKNGFSNIIYSSQKRAYSEYNKVDKWFGATTTLTVNPSKDIITLAIHPFEINTQNELNIVLDSISNKSSKYTEFSRKIKKLIDKNYFKKRIKNKIARASSNEINYAYTLSLLSQFNNLKSLKLSLATKYFQSKYYKKFAKNASNNFLYFIQNNIASNIHNKFIKINKPSLELKEMEEHYNITINSGKYDIYHKVNKKCNTYYDNRKITRSVRDNGDIYNTTYQDKTYGCSIIGGIASSRSDLNTLFSTLAQNRGFTYKKSFLPKNNLIAFTNRERVDSKYVGVDRVKEAEYKESRCNGLYIGKIVNFEYTVSLFGSYTAPSRVEGVDKESGNITLKRTDSDGYEYVFNTTCLMVKSYN